MILLEDDSLRGALLKGKAGSSNNKDSAATINDLVTDLLADGWIKIEKTKVHQLLRVADNAPLESDSSDADLKRIEEVKECFRQQEKEGAVSTTPEYTDAEFDFVSTG